MVSDVGDRWRRVVAVITGVIAVGVIAWLVWAAVSGFADVEGGNGAKREGWSDASGVLLVLTAGALSCLWVLFRGDRGRHVGRCWQRTMVASVVVLAMATLLAVGLLTVAYEHGS